MLSPAVGVRWAPCTPYTTTEEGKCLPQDGVAEESCREAMSYHLNHPVLRSSDDGGLGHDDDARLEGLNQI